MSPRSEQLRLRLREAVVTLCKEEAFYLKELRIEGTLCIVSDQSTVLITQISEQIGDAVIKQETSNELPQLDPEQRSVAGGEKRKLSEEEEEEHRKKHQQGENATNLDPSGPRLGLRAKSRVDYKDLEDGGSYAAEAIEKSAFLEQVSINYQTFGETEQDTSVSQLDESIQEFPQITKINGKFQCPLCEKAYSFKHSAKAHLSTHNKNMKFECKMCSAKFAYSSSLNSHTKKHHPESMSKEYVCDICQQICFNLPSLKQHYTWRHKDMKVPMVYDAEDAAMTEDATLQSQSQPVPASPNQLHPVPASPSQSHQVSASPNQSQPVSARSVFPGQQDCTTNQQQHQQQEVSMSPGSQGAAGAMVVGAGQGTPGGRRSDNDAMDILQQVMHRYNSNDPTGAIVQQQQQQLQLQHHLHQQQQQQQQQQQHQPTFVPGTLHNVPIFSIHNVSMLPATPAHTQSLPPRTVYSTSAPSPAPAATTAPLTQHTTPTTAAPAPAPSPKEKVQLSDHFDEVNVQTQHGMYKFQCKTCSNMFKSRHALYEHINTHLGRKPFSCDICGQTFAHHSTLYNHKRNKHTFISKAEKEAQFKFKCPRCERKFEFPSALDRHFAKYPDHSIPKDTVDVTLNDTVMDNSTQEMSQETNIVHDIAAHHTNVSNTNVISSPEVNTIAQSSSAHMVSYATMTPPDVASIAHSTEANQQYAPLPHTAYLPTPQTVLPQQGGTIPSNIVHTSQ